MTQEPQDPQRSLDGYGPQDMAIPEWKLIQQTGGNWAKQLGANPGQFHNAVTDEIVDELQIIVVDILMGRAKWGVEITDAGPLCASIDVKSNLSINGDDCSQCPDRMDAPWAADATKRRQMCCLNYTILAINLEDYMPAIVRGHGISALPLRQLITQLKMNKALRGDYHRAIVSIKSQEKSTPYGTAWCLHPKIIELITDQVKADELKAESNRLLGSTIALPVGRPEEDELSQGEPVGYTLEGKPVHDEGVKQKMEEYLAAQQLPETATPPVPQTVAEPDAPPAQNKEEQKEKTEEAFPKKEPLDLDF